ncbi:NUDIX hydrolase [Streptomyces sp. NPDC058953]|uniref:NUDIX hydrolase n=1 Tax=unclassified Streptomyces TaxID=2593676 RepID=UPI0036CAD5B7
MGTEQELVDIVDDADRVTGRATRGEAYARGLFHRVAFVLVRDGRDRVFVHRRAADKRVFPSRYHMFVGGVVGAGETYDDAALREAEEELGVEGLPRPEPLFTFRYDSGTGLGSWWSAVYQVRCTLPVRPQEEEIAWWDFLPDEEVERRLTSWEWAPDGLAAWERLRLRGGGGIGGDSGSDVAG